MPDYTRDELLALTPSRYLADGYLDDTGMPRKELGTDYATAASTQLLAADVPAQELAFTYEAFRMLVNGLDVPTEEGAREALDEALVTVARMIRQPNNEGLETWLGDCVAAIRQPADIDPLLLHIQAVVRLYTLIASLPAPSEPSSGSSPELSQP